MVFGFIISDYVIVVVLFEVYVVIFVLNIVVLVFGIVFIKKKGNKGFIKI